MESNFMWTPNTILPIYPPSLLHSAAQSTMHSAAQSTMALSLPTKFYHRLVALGGFRRREAVIPVNHANIPHPHSIVFLEVLSLFIGIAQVKFQGTQYSPFDTYPITMTTGVVTLIIYFLVREALHWLSFDSQSRANAVISHFAAISGYTSLICIASTLLPNKAQPFFILSCSFILAAVMLYPVLRARRRHYSTEPSRVWGRRIIQRFSQYLWRIIIGRFQSSSGYHGREILPLYIVDSCVCS